MKRTWGIALALVGVSTLAAAAVNVSVNGVTYSIPNDNERGWGQNVRTWIQAISSNTLQPTGGQFILSNEIDFGGSFGLKSTYYKSRTANPASLGAFRLANADTICFRNSGNSGNLCFGPSATGNGFISYDSVDLVGTSLTQTLTNKTLAVGSNSITGTSGKTAQFNSSTGALEASSVTSSDLSASVTATQDATSANTASKIVKRDSSGNFSAGTVTANLTGNVTGNVTGNLTGNVTGNVSGSSASFTGSLSGDVTGTQGSTTVATVGGKTASAVATSVADTVAATNANTASTIVKRDASGNFSAGTITASLTGNVTGNVTGNASGSAASFTGSLSGDVTGTQGATSVASVGGKTSSAVAQSVTDTVAATNANTASTIVKRDASGNFSAGTITGTLSGNATNVTGTVALGNGGTGQTTQQAAINALTGTQSSGKYLRSDGTDAKLSSIQAADVPTLNQNTTGTAANVTGTVALANGGTGQTTRQAAINALTGTQSSGKYLRSDGTDATLSSIQAGDVPTLNQNTTGSAASFTGSLSGDVTGTQSATSIASNAVTNAKLAQVSTATIKGRTTAGTGNVEDLTATQTTALLNNFVGDSGSGGTKGLVPAPASGDAAAGKFLKSDGNWSVPAGAGDVTGPASSVDGAVTVFNGTSGKTLKQATITEKSVLVGGANNTLSSVAPSTAGKVLTSDGTSWTSSTLVQANGIRNAAIKVTLASSRITVELKQADGSSDCSSTSPCIIETRSPSGNTVDGLSQNVITTAPGSINPATTDSLGLVTATGGTLYVYFVQDTTNEVCLSSKRFSEAALQSPTSISGGSKTSATTLYCTSAHTTQPIRMLGKIDLTWTSGTGITAVGNTFMGNAFQSGQVYVMHPSNNSYGIEWVQGAGSTCSSGTCSGTTSPGISNITYSSTGAYTLNFTAGAFSANPTCLVGSANRASGQVCNLNPNCSTTSCSINCYSGTTLANDNPSAICVGTR